MSAAMLTALQQPILRVSVFVQLTFVGSPAVVANMWTGIGPVSWLSQTWLGLGTFLNISVIEDTNTISPKGMQITISGIDPTLLSNVSTNYQLGLPATVFLALYDSSSVLVNSPFVSWQGRMDKPEATLDGTTASITINCENRLIDLNIPVDRRYTQADQQMQYPGDLGMDFVDSIQEVTLHWGTSLNTTNI